MQAKVIKPWAMLFWGLILLWGCFPATMTMAVEQRPSGIKESSAPPVPSPLSSAPSPASSPDPAPASGSSTYQRTPAKTTAPVPPVTSRPEEKRGKYSNPYDRSVPLQGDTHKSYAPARRDAFRR